MKGGQSSDVKNVLDLVDIIALYTDIHGPAVLASLHAEKASGIA